LSTYAAIALYEICVRYRDNPGGVTSRKPVGWWTDALSNLPGGDRREWRKFKNERVKEAVAEINQETDLEIELIEHRQGRVVDEVQFAVRRRARSPFATSADKPVDANLVLRAETLGIREIKLDGLIKEFGDDRVREQLDALERRAANNSLRAVDNAYSYLRSLLRNEREAPAPADADEEQDLESPPAQPTADAAVPPDAAANTTAATVAAESTTPITPADSAGERIRMMRREIEALPQAQRQVWVDRALQALATKGLLTAIVSRRAAQGDVMHGLLGSMVVQTYAAATYGADWNTV